MPRQRRTWVPNAGAHTISRFVDRRYYLIDRHDRRLLLDSIERADDRWDWRWLSYAAMSTHLHYGHIAGEVEPDRFFRSAHTRFALRYHRRETRETLGHVFAARPTTYAIKASLLARLVAYHHRNPVKAGVVERASQSTWTSHRAYLRLDPAPPWLDVEWALDVLGFRDTAAGRRLFDEFVTEVDLDDWQGGPQPGPVVVTGSRGLEDVDWSRLVALARAVTNLPANESLASRRRKAVKTRQVIAYVATRDLGQTYSAVGTKLGMKTGSVFNLLSRMTGTDADVQGPVDELRRRLAAA